MSAFSSLSIGQLYTQLNSSKNGLPAAIAEKRVKEQAKSNRAQSWLTEIIAYYITFKFPFSPFADLLGLSVAHMQQVIAIAIILCCYMLTADLLKIICFRINEKRHLAVQR
jgi:hypothetical protein